MLSLNPHNKSMPKPYHPHVTDERLCKLPLCNTAGMWTQGVDSRVHALSDKSIMHQTHCAPTRFGFLCAIGLCIFHLAINLIWKWLFPKIQPVSNSVFSILLSPKLNLRDMWVPARYWDLHPGSLKMLCLPWTSKVSMKQTRNTRWLTERPHTIWPTCTYPSHVLTWDHRRNSISGQA